MTQGVNDGRIARRQAPSGTQAGGPGQQVTGTTELGQDVGS